MKFALLSNVNVDSLARRVAGHEGYVPEGFGAWTRELADPAAPLWAFAPAVVFVLVDGRELLRGRDEPGAAESEVDAQLGWIEGAAARAPGTKFLVSSLDVPPLGPRTLRHPFLERRVEERWRAGLAALATRCANVYVLDTKELVEEHGRAAFYSSKRWYLGALRWSLDGEKLLARELVRVLGALSAAPKKCLVLDLDNTLWGGIVGEDGVAGLRLAETGEGARYKDFQRRILRLKELGVVLAIVSKNNPDDAFEVFDTHPQMVLRRGDFAAHRINWTPKPQNLRDLAADLDLGLDSFVFVDDNPVEREAVRSELPEVTVPEFPSDTTRLPEFLDALHREHFFALESTDEDRQRTASYLANAQRAAARTSAGSIEEFLAGLATRITLGPAREDDVARVAQLTQKTNQFNLTTRRYTEQEIDAFRRADPRSVLVASVADKYGDNGKVCVLIVRRTGAHAAELDTFLMSCRVMGRYIEDQILGHVVETLRAAGVTALRVTFAPTKKNAPARSFVERLDGGRVVAETPEGGRTWEFDIAAASPVTRPPYAELVAGDA